MRGKCFHYHTVPAQPAGIFDLEAIKTNHTVTEGGAAWQRRADGKGRHDARPTRRTELVALKTISSPLIFPAIVPVLSHVAVGIVVVGLGLPFMQATFTAHDGRAIAAQKGGVSKPYFGIAEGDQQALKIAARRLGFLSLF